MFRKRLKQRKMARLEVHVRKDDAALIRNVIRALGNPHQEQATRALLREYFGTGQEQGLKALRHLKVLIFAACATSTGKLSCESSHRH
jgi:hypothetical protein